MAKEKKKMGFLKKLFFIFVIIPVAVVVISVAGMMMADGAEEAKIAAMSDEERTDYLYEKAQKREEAAQKREEADQRFKEKREAIFKSFNGTYSAAKIIVFSLPQVEGDSDNKIRDYIADLIKTSQNKLKEGLKDPDSYEAINYGVYTTNHVDSNKINIKISIEYRAKNSFGGFVVSTTESNYIVTL